MFVLVELDGTYIYTVYLDNKSLNLNLSSRVLIVFIMAATDVASTLVFAAGCEFIRDNDGHFSMAWVNGTAVDAVRGAAVDYIEPKFHMAVTTAGNVHTYAPAADLGRLLSAEVPLPVAMVVVGMRRICASFHGSQLNIAELAPVEEDVCEVNLDEATWKVLTDGSTAFHQLIDMGPTILGMNGLSLMQKGHNYLESDTMWSRLMAAADIEASWSKLGAADFTGIYFHDALHPFAAEWKVRLASDVNSPLVRHSNGVLVKRLPGVPAGTTIVFVTLAAIKELQFARPQVSSALEALVGPLEAMAGAIRSAPLDHCAAFPRAMTRANLEKVSKVEPLAAFIYGACTAVFDRKTTILKSMAFKSNAGKIPGMTAQGRGWAEALEAPEFSDDDVDRLFATFQAAMVGGDFVAAETSVEPVEEAEPPAPEPVLVEPEDVDPVEEDNDEEPVEEEDAGEDEGDDDDEEGDEAEDAEE